MPVSVSQPAEAPAADAPRLPRRPATEADPSGAASIEWFDRWIKTRDPKIKQRILDYNEDDCVAMRVSLDAMRTMPVRPD